MKKQKQWYKIGEQERIIIILKTKDHDTQVVGSIKYLGTVRRRREYVIRRDKSQILGKQGLRRQAEEREE
jgi:hypothetical protein